MEERELTEKEKAKVEEYLRDGAKLRRAVASTVTNRRTSSRARQISNGNNDALHRAWFERLRSSGVIDRLRHIVCEQLQWCKHRKNKTLAWLLKIVQAIVVLLAHLGGTIANIMYMALSGFFDLLCECA